MVNGRKTRDRSPTFNDHFSQAALFYHSQTPHDQKHIREALTFELSKVEALHVRERVLENFSQVDAGIVNEVAPKVGVISVKRSVKTIIPKPSPALSAYNLPGDPYAGRNVGVILSPGFNNNSVKDLKRLLKAKGVKATLLGEFHGEVKGQDGSLNVDKTFKTTGSVHFDGLFVPAGKKSIALITQNTDVILMLNEAFKHHKTIALPKESGPLLEQTMIQFDEGITVDAKSFVEALKAHRHWNRKTETIPV
jgi:catalase